MLVGVEIINDVIDLTPDRVRETAGLTANWQRCQAAVTSPSARQIHLRASGAFLTDTLRCPVSERALRSLIERPRSCMIQAVVTGTTRIVRQTESQGSHK